MEWEAVNEENPQHRWVNQPGLPTRAVACRRIQRFAGYSYSLTLSAYQNVCLRKLKQIKAQPS